MDATSFRTRVFAYRIEFSWILRRTWIVVVDNDHNCPVTAFCEHTIIRAEEFEFFT